ncbi:MAG: hypothetical protein RI897_4088, partial [Verrucomicrobiota bacterium]
PNELAKSAYHRMINHTPALWGGVYHLLNLTAAWQTSTPMLGKVKKYLAQYIRCYSPNTVLSTYPLYAHLIKSIYPNPANRPFKLGVVVTDSITINRAWTAAGADFFCVADPETALTLKSHNIDPQTVFTTGFPVSSHFAKPQHPISDWQFGQTFRILYILNHGSRKALKTAKKLLELPSTHLTIVTGKNHRLHHKLQPLLQDSHAQKLNLLGWTNTLPDIMSQSHLIITKAGGATLQEAIAAGKPVIINQIVPGQEVGNAQLVTNRHMGAIAQTPKEVAAWCQESLRKRGRLYRKWRLNTEHYHQPNASLEIARLTLQHHPKPPPPPKFTTTLPETLLADFYVTSQTSGGSLPLPAITQLYGQMGFAVACVVHQTPTPPSPETQARFLLEFQTEQKRAWNLYKLLLLPGLEFPTPDHSPDRHLNFLSIALQKPVEFTNCLQTNITTTQNQGGLAIALLPAKQKHAGKDSPPTQSTNTWNAWGFTGPSLPTAWPQNTQLPCIAGSRLRDLPDIRSWKSTIHCDRNPTAILNSIRLNQNLGLTCLPN